MTGLSVSGPSARAIREAFCTIDAHTPDEIWIAALEELPSDEVRDLADKLSDAARSIQAIERESGERIVRGRGRHVVELRPLAEVRAS